MLGVRVLPANAARQKMSVDADRSQATLNLLTHVFGMLLPLRQVSFHLCHLTQIITNHIVRIRQENGWILLDNFFGHNAVLSAQTIVSRVTRVLPTRTTPSTSVSNGMVSVSARAAIVRRALTYHSTIFRVSISLKCSSRVAKVRSC